MSSSHCKGGTGVSVEGVRAHAEKIFARMVPRRRRLKAMLKARGDFAVEDGDGEPLRALAVSRVGGMQLSTLPNTS